MDKARKSWEVNSQKAPGLTSVISDDKSNHSVKAECASTSEKNGKKV
jgi:hypothetical protein